ncbi:hypothetical protein TTHERM_00400760 (macronuclear) [Tetrahymena thermophila SB210]|uniref:Uncharacterized protein n=1 Tax=Tetrahymena thermophila (strain SB210) TaxID=312017 RepID=I7ME08_TETTS|nr:hypothetical protein TTHERM_00400760 [Tetrahymena thermophila SB210]EAR93804.1 hypothetical protein TTHERM_00400760 [Tetrahymena thermophila SB210]|eukprot:XP_001014049.1 hypothetical protein TTHERM_00400760 [Tetrahymena thermophila SB210]
MQMDSYANQIQTNNNYEFSIQAFLDIVEIYFSEKELQNTKKSNTQIQQINKESKEREQIQISICQVNSQGIQSDSYQTITHFHSKNSNIMKNILKSFQRYIENEEDEKQKQFFCYLSKVSYGHSQLCKILKFSLKTEGKRWNMKAKNLVEKSKIKPLFEYYLTNINKLWLDNSKVSNKNEHQIIIQQLLKQIQNPEDCCKIRYYKKNKSIIKSN